WVEGPFGDRPGLHRAGLATRTWVRVRTGTRGGRGRGRFYRGVLGTVLTRPALHPPGHFSPATGFQTRSHFWHFTSTTRPSLRNPSLYLSNSWTFTASILATPGSKVQRKFAPCRACNPDPWARSWKKIEVDPRSVRLPGVFYFS